MGCRRQPRGATDRSTTVASLRHMCTERRMRYIQYLRSEAMRSITPYVRRIRGTRTLVKEAARDGAAGHLELLGTLGPDADVLREPASAFAAGGDDSRDPSCHSRTPGPTR